MSEYHVGIGLPGKTIFAGTLNKSKTLWLRRSDVTDEAVDAVAAYLLETEQAMSFSYNGKRYRISVDEVEK